MMLKKQLLVLLLALLMIAAFVAGSLSAAPRQGTAGAAMGNLTSEESAAVDAANALLLTDTQFLSFMPFQQK
jgi:hypothetical protein